MPKNIRTIPSDNAFLDVLAEGLWHQAGGDIFVLSQSLILLPTRRACRYLREAFLRRIDKTAAILPRMQPLGDIDEDEFYFEASFIGQGGDNNLPPAITPMRRQLLLTQLIRKKDPDISLDQAAQMAEALAQFLDEVQIEECSLDHLADLVQEQDLAQHWQEIVKFLEILTQAWPQMLAAEGCLEPVDRRNRLLRHQAALWRQTPPSYPVIAAGSTGSMKATAELLDVIASMPSGCVILPGLDQQLDEEAWQAITESHPQYGLKDLLEKCGVERHDVQPWHQPTPPSPRVRLLQESMRPAEVSEAWRDLQPSTISKDAVTGLTRLDLDHPQHEAQVIALRMREALEIPDRQVLLVTPDRSLAERVRLMLMRWGIAVNDSAGASLLTQPVGAFLVAILKASVPHAGAVDYLTLLKHPLAACGMDPGACRAQARAIELAVWRNIRPEHSDALLAFQKLLQPLTVTWDQKLPLIERLRSHIHVAEAVAASDADIGMERLWRGDAGEAAAEWLDDWQNAAVGFSLLTGEEYTALFLGLARCVTIRPSYGQHPRLSILGPLEARLLQADLIILGGLNESIWPLDTSIDPWMSRPMKRKFGLPLPERRIGLAAHDFVQLASAPEVMLTRSRRTGNAPAVPSRFLLQLETVLQALGYSDDVKDALAPTQPWAEWAHHLDEPSTITPCPKPQPRPPVSARPQRLSVTEIGTWRRNPYAIYAKHVLKLRKLEELDAVIDASDRGIIIHAVLESFTKKYPDTLPDDALQKLLSLGRDVFAAYDEYPEVKAFWWPRFERIATWFIDTELQRRTDGIRIMQVEASGRTMIDGFTLEGRADRIDMLPDQRLEIIDYKTGSVPSQKSIIFGYEPQLPLLASLVQQGGFKDIAATSVGALAYWELKGGSIIAKQHLIDKKPVQNLIDEAQAGLQHLIASFSDVATPYEAVPKPRLQPRYNDYAHLARLAEWGRTEEGE